VKACRGNRRIRGNRQSWDLTCGVGVVRASASEVAGSAAQNIESREAGVSACFPAPFVRHLRAFL
jgi:hypothetical protein